MSIHTFYIAPEYWGRQCTLAGQEARHLSQVLRIASGDTVRLLDGAGRSGLFRVCAVRKRDVDLEMTEETIHPRPASRAILALAWSKATRRGFFMEKAVEFAAHEIWLWQGDHSQGRMPADAGEAWTGPMIAVSSSAIIPGCPPCMCCPAVWKH